MSKPFARDIAAQARELAAQYRYVIEADEEGDGYIGCTVEMPTVMGGGDNPAECYQDTIDATITTIATLLEAGDAPPSPSREGKRDQQLNIRLSASEKLTLEGAAARAGYRSVSDFVRAAAIDKAR